MIRIASLTAAALVAAAGAAAAQHGPMGMDSDGIDFAAIDSDGNGSLSRAELQARAQARLAAADANGNGILERTEIIAMFPAPPQRMFDVFSADPGEEMADRLLAMLGATEAGQVDVAALADRRVNMLLAFADEDRDAAISTAEAEAMQERRGGWRSGHRDHRGGPDGGRGERSGPESAEPPRG